MERVRGGWEARAKGASSEWRVGRRVGWERMRVRSQGRGVNWWSVLMLLMLLFWDGG